MKIREGIEPELVPQLLTYNQKPSNVKSRNIQQFIDQNWMVLETSPNVYFEYHKTPQGDFLALYLIGSPDDPAFSALSGDPQVYCDPTRCPENTDLLGAAPCLILPGEQSVNECWIRTNKRKIMENSDPYGFDARKNADPRKILDDIFKNRDVQALLDRSGCRPRQIRQETYKGIYRVELECRMRDKPFSVIMGVQPTAMEILFSISADPRSNQFLSRRVKGEAELDPERLGYAVRALQPVLKALLDESQRI